MEKVSRASVMKKKLVKENILYAKLVVFCVMCKGRSKYKAMPGHTTCMKHKQPNTRKEARDLIKEKLKEQGNV